MGNESFVFYKSFYDAIELLPECEQLNVYQAIARYAIAGEELPLEGASAIIFTMAKPQLDANTKRRSDGQKGGRPSKRAQKPLLNDEKPVVFEKETSGFEKENHRFEEKKPNVNVNANVNENVNANVDVNDARGGDNNNDNCNYSDQEEIPQELRDPEFAAINTAMVSATGGAINNPTHARQCFGWIDAMGADMVLYAIERGAETCPGKCGWPYVNGVLKGWEREGLVTRELVEANEKRREEAKARAPAEPGNRFAHLLVEEEENDQE